MQCPHCAPPDSIRYDTSCGVQCYRCQVCRQIFQRLRRGKDPALKQRAFQLHLEGMEMRAIARVPGSITRRPLAGWYKLPKHSQQAKHRLKPTPSSKSMISALSSQKNLHLEHFGT